jgi:crotonobetainyl-CoA:carnitine CoA-transferase CaiB-like acyl-CoA transferase
MVQQTNSLLDGLKVIELSHVMAAPVCGLMLADMGADVIKVERLPAGDDTRRALPRRGDLSAPFTMVNRNKRGVALHLKTAGGREALKDLILSADVFIENYRPGAMAHYGVGYEQIQADHPGLIYCSLSGFGATGPYRGRGGFDLVAQGMSGLMSITGEGPGRPPVKVGSPVTDITAGILSAMSILAALNQRHATGQGQFLDTSLFEAGIALTYWQSAIYLNSGEVPGAMGSAHPLMAPYQAFQTQDGWINVGAANQSTWLKLLDCLEASSLADDPRFAHGADRMRHLDALVDELTGFFVGRKTADWMERLDRFGVPAGPVYDMAQMAADPQTVARDMIRTVGAGGATDDQERRVLGHPVKFSAAGTEVRRDAPRFGEHTHQALAEVGYTDDQIAELAAAGCLEVT